MNVNVKFVRTHIAKKDSFDIKRLFGSFRLSQVLMKFFSLQFHEYILGFAQTMSTVSALLLSLKN